MSDLLELEDTFQPFKFPENERYLNRLKKFKPKLVNANKWWNNAIVTEHPAAVIQPYQTRFKVFVNDKIKYKFDIDAVYKCLMAIKTFRR